MDLFEIYIDTGRIPIDEKSVKVHGCKIRGVNYCVVAHFRSGEIIEDKVSHMVTDDLSSLDIHKNRGANSLGTDMDNEGG